MWRYALDAASLHWIGNGDHDNGNLEYPWWLTQKTTTIFALGDAFTPMYSYERSRPIPTAIAIAVRATGRPAHRVAEGGSEKIWSTSPGQCPRLRPTQRCCITICWPLAAICASHTSATGAETDWRNSHWEVEPIVEIYQGDRRNYERPGRPGGPTSRRCGSAPSFTRGSSARPCSRAFGWGSSAPAITIRRTSVSATSMWRSRGARRSSMPPGPARLRFDRSHPGRRAVEGRRRRALMGDEFTATQRPRSTFTWKARRL